MPNAVCPRYRMRRSTYLRRIDERSSLHFGSGIGDIEVLTENGDFFEAVEVKHDIPISQQIVSTAFEKFAKIPLRRYYLLTTAEPNVKHEDAAAVDERLHQIHAQHGCQVIVNGVLPSLKYYLRLFDDSQLFLDRYTSNLQSDFDRGTDIKTIHLNYWKQLLNSVFPNLYSE